jgi:hypothetical protein
MRAALLSNNAASDFRAAITISGCKTSGNKIVNIVGGATTGGGNGQEICIGTGWYTGSSTISSITIFTSAGNFDGGNYRLFGSD